MTLQEFKELSVPVYQNIITNSTTQQEKCHDLLMFIKNGSEWTNSVIEGRKFTRGSKEYTEIKKFKVPCVIWGGKSDNLKREKTLIKPNGLRFFDIDHVREEDIEPLKSHIIQYTGVIAVWKSFGGKGIAFISAVNERESSNDSYLKILNEYNKSLGKIKLVNDEGKPYSLDVQNADLSRLNVLSYDPQLTFIWDFSDNPVIPFNVDVVTRKIHEFSNVIKSISPDDKKYLPFWKELFDDNYYSQIKKGNTFTKGRWHGTFTSSISTFNYYGIPLEIGFSMLDEVHFKKRNEHIYEHHRKEAEIIYKKNEKQYGAYLQSPYSINLLNYDITLELKEGQYLTDLFPKLLPILEGLPCTIIKSDVGTGKTRAFIAEDSPFSYVILAAPTKVIADQNNSAYGSGIYNENIKDIKPHITSTYQSLIKCIHAFKAKYKVSPVIILDEIHKILDEIISDDFLSNFNQLKSIGVERIIALSATPIVVDGLFNDFCTIDIQSVESYTRGFTSFDLFFTDYKGITRAVPHSDHVRYFLQQKLKDEFLMIRINSLDEKGKKLSPIIFELESHYGKGSTLLFNSYTRTQSQAIKDLIQTNIIPNTVKCIIFTDAISNGTNLFFEKGEEKDIVYLDYDYSDARNIKQFSSRIRNAKSVEVYYKRKPLYKKGEIDTELKSLENYIEQNKDKVQIKEEIRKIRLKNDVFISLERMELVKRRLDLLKRDIYTWNKDEADWCFNPLKWTVLLDNYERTDLYRWPKKMIFQLLGLGFTYKGHEEHGIWVTADTENKALSIKEKKELKRKEMEEEWVKFQKRDFTGCRWLKDLEIFYSKIMNVFDIDHENGIEICGKILIGKKGFKEDYLKCLNKWERMWMYQMGKREEKTDIWEFYNNIKIGEKYTIEELEEKVKHFKIGALDDDKKYRYVGDVVGEMFTLKRGQKRTKGGKCNVWIIVNDNPLGVRLKDRSKIEIIDDKKLV